MTIQVLMSTSVIARPLPPIVPPPGQTSEPAAEPTASKRIPIAERMVAPSSCPLPNATSGTASKPSSAVVERRYMYQANHQAELLCLQAEVDALWHHLHAIQQEKRGLAAQS